MSHSSQSSRFVQNLTVWQAYLQDTPLQQVNFADADLKKCVFANSFSTSLLVMGISIGTIAGERSLDRNHHF